jgi:hypothetical protein
VPFDSVSRAGVSSLGIQNDRIFRRKTVKIVKVLERFVLLSKGTPSDIALNPRCAS